MQMLSEEPWGKGQPCPSHQSFFVEMSWFGFCGCEVLEQEHSSRIPSSFFRELLQSIHGIREATASVQGALLKQSLPMAAQMAPSQWYPTKQGLGPQEALLSETGKINCSPAKL